MISPTITDAGIIQHPMLRSLIRIDLDLTGLCNRQCTFCPRSLTAEPVYPNVNKHMSLNTIEIIIKELQSIDFDGWFELAGRGESTLHRYFEKIVDMVTAQPRKWKVRLTTNGYEIEDWWPTLAHKFDQLILNSYESKEQWIERQSTYSHLPNGKAVYHYYKQDGYTIDEINDMPGYIEDGKSWKHAFNNRAGYFKHQDRSNNKDLNYIGLVTTPSGEQITIAKSACWHPMRQIFIDYDGNYQMCCNDWSHQIKIGNVNERSLIDMYLNDPKINRIRWRLLNRDRQAIAPCARCDDIQGATRNTVTAIDKFVSGRAYKEHVVPLAKIGRHFDEGLKKGL